MTLDELLVFMRHHSLAVQSSVTKKGAPQASVVGIITTETFEIFFDTLDSTRKCQNLRDDRRIAFVIYDESRTVQYEGNVTEPTDAKLQMLKQQYFKVFPEGRERESWPGITYFLARPTWIRYSDYSGSEPAIFEFGLEDLDG